MCQKKETRLNRKKLILYDNTKVASTVPLFHYTMLNLHKENPNSQGSIIELVFDYKDRDGNTQKLYTQNNVRGYSLIQVPLTIVAQKDSLSNFVITYKNNNGKYKPITMDDVDGT